MPGARGALAHLDDVASAEVAGNKCQIDLTVKKNATVDPAAIRSAARVGEVTGTWLRASVTGLVERDPTTAVVTIPSKLSGASKSEKTRSAGFRIVVPGSDQHLLLLQARGAAVPKLGQTVTVEGLLFSGKELDGTPKGSENLVFLLPSTAGHGRM